MHVEEVLNNRGGPARPLSDQERMDKFVTNATRSISPEAAHQLAADIPRLAALPVAGQALEALA